MADSKVATPGQVVMIGCKHPHGVTLNLKQYAFPNGVQGMVRRQGDEATVTLRGYAHRYNEPDPAADTGGYVLTPVPKDFWDAWIATHADFCMVLDRTILGPHQDAKGQARGHTGVQKMYSMAPKDAAMVQKSKLTGQPAEA